MMITIDSCVAFFFFLNWVSLQQFSKTTEFPNKRRRPKLRLTFSFDVGKKWQIITSIIISWHIRRILLQLYILFRAKKKQAIKL